MTARWQIKRTIAKALREAGGAAGETARRERVSAPARLARWQEEWKLLPIPKEFKDTHAYDQTGDTNQYFFEDVLKVWDRFPDLRDAICSLFGVRPVSDSVELRANLAILVSLISLAVAICSRCR